MTYKEWVHWFENPNRSVIDNPPCDFETHEAFKARYLHKVKSLIHIDTNQEAWGDRYWRIIKSKDVAPSDKVLQKFNHDKLALVEGFYSIGD